MILFSSSKGLQKMTSSDLPYEVWGCLWSFLITIKKSRKRDISSGWFLMPLKQMCIWFYLQVLEIITWPRRHLNAKFRFYSVTTACHSQSAQCLKLEMCYDGWMASTSACLCPSLVSSSGLQIAQVARASVLWRKRKCMKRPSPGQTERGSVVPKGRECDDLHGMASPFSLPAVPHLSFSAAGTDGFLLCCEVTELVNSCFQFLEQFGFFCNI